MTHPSAHALIVRSVANVEDSTRAYASRGPALGTPGDNALALDASLLAALQRSTGAQCPPRLAESMHYALFPGGARLRPRLLLAVAAAEGASVAGTSAGKACIDGFALAAATAIEFIHCASLVHDDLPCFDDAATRRGKASVHCAYDAATAVLVGDALIFAAFEAISHSFPLREVSVASAALREIVACGGSARGLIAGQAWELSGSADESGPRVHEPVNLGRYHAQKTGALFEAACVLGALTAGADPAAYRVLGASIGVLYQCIDDVLDQVSSSLELGKPVGQDDVHARPNVTHRLGLAEAIADLHQRYDVTLAAIPPSRGADALRALLVWGLAPALNAIARSGGVASGR